MADESPQVRLAQQVLPVVGELDPPYLGLPIRRRQGQFRAGYRVEDPGPARFQAPRAVACRDLLDDKPLMVGGEFAPDVPFCLGVSARDAETLP